MTKKMILKLANKSRGRLLLGGIVGLLVLPLLVFGLLSAAFWDRAYLGVSINGSDLSGKSRSEVRSVVTKLATDRLGKDIVIALQDRPDMVVGKAGDFASYDIDKTVDKVMAYGRTGDWSQQVRERIRFVRSPSSITPVYGYNKGVFDQRLADMVRPFETPVIESELGIAKDGVYLTKSESGLIGDRDYTLSAFENYLAWRSGTPRFALPLNKREPVINTANSQGALQKANTLLSRQPLVLKSSYVPGSTWSLNGSQLLSFVALKKLDSGAIDTVIEDYKVASWSGQIADLINRDPIEARFELAGERVSEFEPAQAGLALDTEALTHEIAFRAFDASQPADVEIPIKTTEPALTTDKVNTYGIKELVGQGLSKFRGSPAGRVHNLSLASSKLNGVLIAPGETFSMYKVVGEVEKSTGYQDAFVILNGRTVPGVGGGLCQVSTTLFRAALAAGLPIVERHQHAYRVYYYEQNSAPGIDAAVYFPSWDLKFVNDTANYLLLQTKVDTKASTAEFNLYGVKDGRRVELTKPVVTNQTPPPPELRIDDPTLARGQENEVDHAVWGANVSFARKVWDASGKEVINETFKSAYKAWQRVVMVGVKDN